MFEYISSRILVDKTVRSWEFFLKVATYNLVIAKMDIIEDNKTSGKVISSIDKELKVFKRNNAQKKQIYKLKYKHGKIITDKKQIVNFQRKNNKKRIINNNNLEEMLDIRMEKIQLALKQTTY